MANESRSSRLPAVADAVKGKPNETRQTPMFRLNNMSLRRKQTLIIMLASGLALLLACAAFVAYDVVTFRAALVDNVSILAEAIGDNCAAAIDISDPKRAEERLTAFRVNNGIVSACIYSPDGTVFAVYQRDKGRVFVPPPLRAGGHEFAGDELHLFHSIQEQNKSVGTIFVACDLNDLSRRINRYIAIAGGVFLGSLMVILVLSGRLQRMVSDPILRLARVLQSVTAEKNYSVRAVKQSDDELGRLIDGFNEMLAQFQRRDWALQATRDGLEVRVQERTAELATANEALQERVHLANLEADVGVALARGATLAQILQWCCEAIVKHLGGAFARIWTLNHRENALELQASAGLYTHLNGPHSRVPVGALKIGLIASERTPHLTNAVVGDPRVGDQEWAKREKMAAFAGYPLIVEGRLLGVVAMFARHPLSDSVMKELSVVSNQIALGIERKRAEAAVTESEERFTQLAGTLTDVFWMATPDMKEVLYVSPAYETLWGRPIKSLREHPGDWMEGIHPEDRERVAQTFAGLASQEGGVSLEFRIVRPDGGIRWVADRGFQVRNQAGQVHRILGVVSDITERKKLEKLFTAQTAARLALAESTSLEQAARKILQLICETVEWDIGQFWSLDARGQVLRCAEIWAVARPDAEEFIKESRKLTIARGVGLAGRVWASGQPAWIDDVVKAANFPRAPLAEKAGLHGAFAFPIFPGREVIHVIEFFSRESRKPDAELLRIFDNIASQINQFIARSRLEGQLIQSQKMETVGKLAAGIAHEFNSIMTAIIGQSELLLHDLSPSSPLCKNATEIHQAADRAATLTRQLLAYGRKQILQPAVLDLNLILKGMDGTLHHIAGRSVDLQIVSSSGSGEIRADAGQIEQVIMNIVINAIDAMPNGGKLTLETAAVVLDREYVSRVPDLKPGEYVMLAITDTGAGMTDAVRARLFEPFFTTKEVGKGTGLGLATCHGIIKQSEGHISVYSEPGRGATFKIFLPKVQGEKRAAGPPIKSQDLPRGTETILLVEDDPALREMAGTLLVRLGYTVLTAANGVEALNVTHQPGVGHIDLLFTDVVMPHMSGKELSDRVRAAHPETKILFTSAYAENAIVHQGVLNPGVALVQKPFTPSALARRVRAILDAPIDCAAPGAPARC